MGYRIAKVVHPPPWVIAYARGEVGVSARPPGAPSNAWQSNEPPPPYSQAEADRIRSALAVIPAHDYDTWLRIGMALHWTGWGEPAFQIWDEWSRTAPEKYDEAVLRQKWGSFK
jgi:hypothetical protein